MSELPKTLEEAVAWLDTQLVQADKDYLDAGQEDAAFRLHHSLGRFIRNKLGLWHDSEISLHLKEVHHIDHPDDMSHYIILEYLKRNYPTVWQLVIREDEV